MTPPFIPSRKRSRRDLEHELAQLREALDAHAEVVAALQQLTDGADRIGGDGYGMPECPWCHAQDEEEPTKHEPDCELVKARAALTKARGGQ